jgi:hypothetical protein
MFEIELNKNRPSSGSCRTGIDLFCRRVGIINSIDPEDWIQKVPDGDNGGEQEENSDENECGSLEDLPVVDLPETGDQEGQNSRNSRIF